MSTRVRLFLILSTGLGLTALLPGCQTAVPPRGLAKYGATVPWIRYEAEDAQANVQAAEASRAYLTPESEAAGRRLVRLEKPGDHLDFQVTRPANGLVLRFSIPDSADGGGQDATLSLYLNGRPHLKLPLTSRYAWSYGDFPWTNQPTFGRAHHFFDEQQVLLPQLAVGDVVRLQIDPGDEAPFYLIDFIELEQVAPPLHPPTNSVSMADFGATPDDDTDDAEAFLRCLEAAKQQHKIAWIPAGTYRLGGSFKGMGGVEVCGAGMWHTRLTGSGAMFYGTGERFSISDLALFGPVVFRNDMSPDNAFFGTLGDGSRITRVWIEHMKCAVWSNHGTKNLRLYGCRIRNTMADGVNLCDGTTDSVVEQCHLRNTGDDALATWSPSGDWSSKVICERNQFIHNTIEQPWHANGLGLYGGRDHLVRGNLVVDTVMSGGGLLISSGHGAIPFAGTQRVESNRFIRTGGECYVDGQNGGLWIHAHDSDIDTPVVIRDLEIIDAPGAGITLHGPRALRHATLQNILIQGPARRGFELMPGAIQEDVRIENLRVVDPQPVAR